MVKNESKYLEQCLQSLQPLRDAIESELIIVDTGSADNTVEIAKRFTDKVYFHPWKDDFSAMRNITISYATGEWFFVIDGDEVLEGAEQIIAFLQSEIEKDYNAASIYVKNFTHDLDWRRFSLITSARLFRKNEKFRYEGMVHNQPCFVGNQIMLNSVLLHYGYLSTDLELMERKFIRTKLILEKELEKDPDNIYYLYQLAVTFGMHKDFDSSIAPIEKAYELAKEKKIDLKYHMYLFTTRALFYQNLQKFDKVEEICKEGLDIREGYLDLYFLLGEVLSYKEKNEDALVYFKKYIEISENYHKMVKDPSVIDYTLGQTDYVYNKVCALLYEKNEKEEALYTILKISDENMVKDSFKRIIDLYMDLKKYEELTKYYTETILEKYPKLRERFKQDLEFMRQYWSESEEEEVARSFAKERCEYGYWHYVWMVNRNKDVELVDCQVIDLNDQSEYYGEFVHYFLGITDDLTQFKLSLSTVSEEKWNQFVSYAYKIFGNQFFDRVLRYVHDKKDVSSIFDYCVVKTFSRYALLFSLSDNTLRTEMLALYFRYGCTYVEKLYRPEVLRQENCIWFSNAEDVFFIMTWRAKQLLKKNKEKAFVEATEKILEKMPQLRKWCNFAEWKKALSEC